MDNQQTMTTINYSTLSKLSTKVGPLLSSRQQSYVAAGSVVGVILLVVIGFDWITAIMFTAGLYVAGLSWQYYKQRKLLDARNGAVINQFAHDNNWSYVSSPEPIEQRPGIIFRPGHSKSILNPIRGNWCQMDFEAYNYKYTVGNGKHSTVNLVRIMEFNLPFALPHMAIDSLIEEFGSFKSVMPALFSDQQRVTLEGDFSKFFNVYALDGTGVTTLTLLAPDTMIVLLEKASKCDIEIVGNKLYFYWSGEAADTKSYKEMFTVAETVLDKIGDKLRRADSALLNSAPVTMQSAINNAENTSRLQPSLAGSLAVTPNKSNLVLSLIVPIITTGTFLGFIIMMYYGISNPDSKSTSIIFTVMSLWPVFITVIVSAFLARKVLKSHKLKQDYDERYNRQ